jgi:hypothetical protein
VCRDPTDPGPVLAIGRLRELFERCDPEWGLELGEMAGKEGDVRPWKRAYNQDVDSKKGALELCTKADTQM